MAQGNYSLSNVNYSDYPLIVVMVGLPARGKSYIATKLSRYLNWINIKCKVFQLINYNNRNLSITMKRSSTISTTLNKDLNIQDNNKWIEIKKKDLLKILKDIEKWLIDNGSVAILDGNNVTKEQRDLIYLIMVKKMNFQLIFIESLCNDEKIINYNIEKILESYPEYDQNNDNEQIREIFNQRFDLYQKSYQILDQLIDSELSFIKYCNNGKSIIINNVSGNTENKIVYYLLNLRITPKIHYLTRHGESIFNNEQRIGGDPELSENGLKYAKVLGDYVNNLELSGLVVWTSFLRRTIDTSLHIAAPARRCAELNEISAGLLDGMTYDEAKQKYPDEFAKRDENKFIYRFPGGESYMDVAAKIEPLLMELERTNNVLIVSHQGTLRCFLGYFQDIDNDSIPYIDLPLHTLAKLTLETWGCQVDFIKMPIECVDTYRPRRFTQLP